MGDDREILAQAQSLVQRGAHAEAARMLMPVARRSKGNTQILLFTAKAARDGGEFALALECLGMARETAPSDPQLANLEANTLAAAGRYEEALAAFDQLIEAHPDFVDAHLNRALTAKETGDEPRALALVDDSLSRHASDPRLLSTKATILKALGRFDEALECADRAVGSGPERARSHYTRGVILHARDELEQAEAALAEAARLGMNDRAHRSALAAVVLDRGRVEEAERLYFDVFASGDPDAGPALARLRREYLGLDDPFDHYAKRAEALPHVAAVWQEWLSQQLAYNEFDLFRQTAEQALKHHPDDLFIQALDASVRAKVDRDGGALVQLEGMVAERPADHSLRLALAEAALVQRRAELAREHATRATALEPLDQTGWCYLSTAYRLLDDPREFALCDYENFVIETEVVPGGSARTAREYAREIAKVLQALHRSQRAPGNQSLRGGTQTAGALFDRPEPAIRDFREAVLHAVRNACQILPKDEEHPFLARNTGDVAVTGSWSVRLKSGAGHHVNHFHGEGWVSSAYYAQLPALPEEGAGVEGFIQFGAPPDDWGLDLTPRCVVRPEPGKLVLFPSYMWHGTIPFTSEGIRLTSAFDFKPA